MSPFAPVLLGPSEVERGTASLAWGKRNWIQDMRAPESSFSPLSHGGVFRDYEASHILVGSKGRLKFNKYSVSGAYPCVVSHNNKPCVIVSFFTDHAAEAWRGWCYSPGGSHSCKVKEMSTKSVRFQNCPCLAFSTLPTTCNPYILSSFGLWSPYI